LDIKPIAIDTKATLELIEKNDASSLGSGITKCGLKYENPITKINQQADKIATIIPKIPLIKNKEKAIPRAKYPGIPQFIPPPVKNIRGRIIKFIKTKVKIVIKS